MTTFRIAQVRVGTPVPYGPQGQPSAIVKLPVDGPIMASQTGLSGDEQGDKKNHGGRDKAIHAYPVSHYPTWANEHPSLPAMFQTGSFGENLVVEGVTEADISLGDRWRTGDALCEVSQGRQPCWKLNVRFGVPDMAVRVQRSGRTGWYFRVLEGGTIMAGADAILVARPFPDWPLSRVSHLLYQKTLDLPALAELASLPGLPPSWQTLARRRLETRQVESWASRVETPSS